MNDNISGWNDWTDALTQSAEWSDMSTPELHGFATAILCVCELPAPEQWNQVVEAACFEALPSALLEFFVEEAEDLAAQIHDPDDMYTYEPLIPDDSHALSVRAQALRQWATGFLTGYGTTGKTPVATDVELIKTLGVLAHEPIEETEFEDMSEEQLEQSLSDFEALYEFARMAAVSLVSPKDALLPVKKISMLGGVAMSEPLHGPQSMS